MLENYTDLVLPSFLLHHSAEKGDFNALRQEIITRRHSLEAHEKTYVEEAMQRCLSVKMRGLEESEVPDAVKEYYATFYQVARHFLKPPSNSPDLETLIHAVKHIEVSTIQDTRKQYMHEEAQRHLLGDFMKEESQGLLPLKRYSSDANIEPELFVLYDHLMIPDDMLHRTKDEDQVYKLLNTKEKRYPFSILGPPGVGKSGTAIRMVASRGGIIVEPSPGLDDQMRAVRGEESTSVIAYQQILFYGGLGHGFAYGVVLCDYLARILHFLITVRKSKKLERDIESTSFALTSISSLGFNPFSSASRSLWWRLCQGTDEWSSRGNSQHHERAVCYPYALSRASKSAPFNPEQRH